MSILSQVKSKIMKDSRQNKTRHFYSLSDPKDRILDVGVSKERGDRRPQENFFLKTFRYAPENYTGLGIDDLSEMPILFPGKRFVEYPGGAFPFLDKEFDWVFSNAVIEHVGKDEDQLFFLNEMLRVGARVFFTTPNKYFPIETHTGIPLLHWIDSAFYKWCRNRGVWHEENLRLFGYGGLKALMDRSDATRYEIRPNRLYGVTMTFTVVCSAESPGAKTR